MKDEKVADKIIPNSLFLMVDGFFFWWEWKSVVERYSSVDTEGQENETVIVLDLCPHQCL